LYRYASDDRGADALRTKVLDAVQMQPVMGEVGTFHPVILQSKHIQLITAQYGPCAAAHAMTRVSRRVSRGDTCLYHASRAATVWRLTNLTPGSANPNRGRQAPQLPGHRRDRRRARRRRGRAGGTFHRVVLQSRHQLMTAGMFHVTNPKPSTLNPQPQTLNPKP
jgi:hypothetical protein